MAIRIFKKIKKWYKLIQDFFNDIVNRLGFSLFCIWGAISLYTFFFKFCLIDQGIFWFPLIVSISTAWVFYIFVEWIPKYKQQQIDEKQLKKDIEIFDRFFHDFCYSCIELLNSLTTDSSKKILGIESLEASIKDYKQLEYCHLKTKFKHLHPLKFINETKESKKFQKKYNTEAYEDEFVFNIILGLKKIIISDIDYIIHNFSHLLSTDDIRDLQDLKYIIQSLGSLNDSYHFYASFLIAMRPFAIDNDKFKFNEMSGLSVRSINENRTRTLL